MDPRANRLAENIETQGNRLAENIEPTADILAENNEIIAKVIHQLEYYFGDANLLLSDYLPGLIKKGVDGWIPLDTLVTLERLSKISTDKDFIATCVVNSNSDLIEVDAARDNVRRKPGRPLPAKTPEWQKLVDKRTVYVRGIPRNVRGYEIINFMETNYGPTDKITLVKSGLEPPSINANAVEQSLCAYVCFQSGADRVKMMADKVTSFHGSQLSKMAAEEFKAKRHQMKLNHISCSVRDAKGTLIQITGLPTGYTLKNVFIWLQAPDRLNWNVSFIKPLEEHADTIIVKMADPSSAAQAMNGVSGGELYLCWKNVKCDLVTGDYEKKVLDALLRDKMLQAGFSRIAKALRNSALHVVENPADTGKNEEVEIDALVDREVMFAQGQEYTEEHRKADVGLYAHPFYY